MGSATTPDTLLGFNYTPQASHLLLLCPFLKGHTPWTCSKHTAHLASAPHITVPL